VHNDFSKCLMRYMSYVNDPNDPNYVVPNTVPPIAEAVEPAPNPLRWLWWLLGLLVLAGLIWALVHACRPANCSTLPEGVWTTTQQTTTWNTLVGYDSAHFTDGNRTAVLNELRTLCNRRLGGHSLATADITGASVFGGLAEGAVGQVLSLVNGNSFCRCS